VRTLTRKGWLTRLHRGATAGLTAALDATSDHAPWTQSHLERLFLELVRAAGLPEPQTKVVVDGVVVDFFWPSHNLVVEVDGYAQHRARRSFTDDRRRDVRHAVAGRRTVRFVYDDVVSRAATVTAQLCGLLAAASGP
jgi:very-short-patch-repair endonuclease